MRRVLIVALVGLLLVGAGGCAAPSIGGLHIPGLGAGRPQPVPTVQVAIPTITTNLAGGSGTNFVQLSVTLGVAGPAVAKTFATQVAAVQNAILADVRARSAAQLDASQGMSDLAGAIQTSVDQVLGSATAVRAVYFTQFVVQ